MPEPQLQIEGLRRLHTTNRVARMLLNYAARQTGAGVSTMTVDTLRGILESEEQSVVSRRELIGTLRAFAQAGCGRFFTGRHGQPSRFVWAVPLAALGAAVVGGASSRPAIGTSALGGAATQGAPSPGEAGMFSHPFRLRPALIVSLNLPNDLTVGEADRLARFIQTLPFQAKV